MRTCSICHFATEEDDVALRCGDARVICVRCWARVTETEHAMPKGLRRQLSAILEGVQGG